MFYVYIYVKYPLNDFQTIWEEEEHTNIVEN